MGQGATLKRTAWLPAAQILSLIITTGVFAVLARHLGPEPFARFAVIVFVFTVTSLVLDLSPAGFLLVYGDDARIRKMAQKSATISTLAGIAVLPSAMLLLGGHLPGGPVRLPEVALLTSALAAQFLTQVPRAVLVTNRRYWQIAAIDVGALAASSALAIALVLLRPSGLILIFQLASMAYLRLGATILLGRQLKPSVPSRPPHPEASSWQFGSAAIPLNVASYASRSIDSGLMPFAVPAALAATYARTFQVVVAPISQAQLSLGPVLIRHLALNRGSENASKRVLLVVLIAGSAIASGLILFAPVIDRFLFGPRWDSVQECVRAMAMCVPGLMSTAVLSWLRQLSPRFAHSIIHLGLVTSAPAIVLFTAYTSGFSAALIALPIASGMAVPALLTVLHSDVLPWNALQRLGILLASLLPPAGLFALLSCGIVR
jgi:O-antigen/teichoic acid export membrane protein